MTAIKWRERVFLESLLLLNHCSKMERDFLPYGTLPFKAGILPPSAEASSWPNAHPRIIPKVIETFYRFLQT